MQGFFKKEEERWVYLFTKEEESPLLALFFLPQVSTFSIATNCSVS
jgi:hypothetical protein